MNKTSETPAVQRGEGKASRKVRIGLSLDQRVVAHFRSSTRYWNKAANDILAEHVGRAGK